MKKGKVRLSENQVSRLLNKGYTYSDIALYEQAITRDPSLEDLVAPNPGGKLTPPGGDVVPRPTPNWVKPPVVNPPVTNMDADATDYVPQSITRADTSTDITPQVIKDKQAERWANIGSVIGQAGGKAGGDQGLKAMAQALKGAAGPVPKDGGMVSQPGIAPFGSFSDVVNSKIKQIQGEGFLSRYHASKLVEMFARKNFGERFLVEQGNKLDAVTFNIQDVQQIDEHLIKFLSEQMVKNDDINLPDIDISRINPETADSLRSGVMHMHPLVLQGIMSNPTVADKINQSVANVGELSPQDALDAIESAKNQTLKLDPVTEQEIKDAPPTHKDKFKQVWDVMTNPENYKTIAKDAGNFIKNVADKIPNPVKDVIDMIRPKIDPDTIKTGPINKTDIAKDAGTAAGMMGSAGAAAEKAAEAALSKNEEMTPHDNHTALRDWTTKIKENLMKEQDFNPTHSDSLQVADFRAGNIQPIIRGSDGRTFDNKSQYNRIKNMSDQFGEIDFSPEARDNYEANMFTANIGPSFEDPTGTAYNFRPTDHPEGPIGNQDEYGPGNYTTMVDIHGHPTDTPIPKDFDWGTGTSFDEKGKYVGRQDEQNVRTKGANKTTRPKDPRPHGMHEKIVFYTDDEGRKRRFDDGE